jgi:hypothetical protein
MACVVLGAGLDIDPPFWGREERDRDHGRRGGSRNGSVRQSVALVRSPNAFERTPDISVGITSMDDHSGHLALYQNAGEAGLRGKLAEAEAMDEAEAGLNKRKPNKR